MKTNQLFAKKKVALSPGVSLSGFMGEQLMVTHLLFEAGAVGVDHAHPHEQLTVVLRGEISVTLGEECKVLKAGEAIAIPGNMRHSVVAHTSAEVLDIFTPIRADLVEKLES